MYTNLVKFISPKSISRSANNYRVMNSLLQTHPLQTRQKLPVYESLLLKAYSVERSLENLPFLMEKCENEGLPLSKYLRERNSTYADLKADYKIMLNNHIKRDYLRGQYYSIELASNLLYLLASYEIQAPDVATELLSIIQEKGLENATLQNLSDMYVYLRRYGDSKDMLTEVETLLRNKMAQEQPVTVDTSGNSVKYYSAIDKDYSVSMLEEAVLTNNQFLKFKINLINKLNGLIYYRELRLDELWEPVSESQERRRVRSLLGMPEEATIESE